MLTAAQCRCLLRIPKAPHYGHVEQQILQRQLPHTSTKSLCVEAPESASDAWKCSAQRISGPCSTVSILTVRCQLKDWKSRFLPLCSHQVTAPKLALCHQHKKHGHEDQNVNC